MPDNSQKDFSKIVKVEIAEDKMEAFLVVNEPDSDQSKSITPQHIYNVIDEAGVKSAINQDIIQEIIDKKQWGKMLFWWTRHVRWHAVLRNISMIQVKRKFRNGVRVTNF